MNQADPIRVFLRTSSGKAIPFQITGSTNVGIGLPIFSKSLSAAGENEDGVTRGAEISRNNRYRGRGGRRDVRHPLNPWVQLCLNSVLPLDLPGIRPIN